MKQDELKNKLVEYFSSIKDACTIAATDFTDERDSNMIVIGIESVKQIYPSTPDYEYTVSILIDTFIEDDEKCELHDKTVKIVTDMIYNHLMIKENYLEIFDKLPVVGVLFEGIEQTISDSSNRAEITLLMYTSF
jgi:hypothetical protein